MPLHPPTCPVVGSPGFVEKLAPVLSVYPYPSVIGVHNVALRKVRVSAEIGADPVAAHLTLPPKAYLVFLKTILSQNLCSTYPELMTFMSFFERAFLANLPLVPVALSNPPLITS